jgi:hypothetical protein
MADIQFILKRVNISFGRYYHRHKINIVRVQPSVTIAVNWVGCRCLGRSNPTSRLVWARRWCGRPEATPGAVMVTAGDWNR